MDSQLAQGEVIFVDRSLADSVALSLDNPCLDAGGIMTLTDMANLQSEDLELIPVRLIGEDCTDVADPVRDLSDAREAHRRILASTELEVRDLKRLLSLAAAALEPHASSAGDESRIYAAITRKLGLVPPILAVPFQS